MYIDLKNQVVNAKLKTSKCYTLIGCYTNKYGGICATDKTKVVISFLRHLAHQLEFNMRYEKLYCDHVSDQF